MKEIKLTQNKIAIVDDDDFDRVSKNKWSFHHEGYAVRGKPQISLHRFIINCPKGKEIDHINRNKLDCRKNNLRICTRAENSRNYNLSITNKNLPRGIEYRPTRKAYASRIKVNGKNIYVGYFKKLEDAVEAYKKASLFYHKEFSIYALNNNS